MNTNSLEWNFGDLPTAGSLSYSFQELNKSMVDNYLKPVFLQTSGNDLRLTEIYLSLDIKGTTHRYIIIVMLRADKTIYTETIKKIGIKIIKEKKSCQKS